MKKVIVIKRTVTVTSRVKLEDYQTDDPREAIAYEKYMPRQEKIEAFVEALEFSEPGDVKVSEEVTIEETIDDSDL